MNAEDVNQTVKWDSKKLREFWEFEYKVRPSESFSGVHFVPVVRKIRKLIGRGRRNILDLGCSNGDLVLSLAEYYPSVSGADIESSKLDELKVASTSSPRINFYSNTELEDLDIRFDAITSLEIIEHLNGKEMEAHIGQIKKLLKPDGIVFFSVPNSEMLARSFVRCPDCGAIFHKVQHVRKWTPKGLSSYLEKSGFEIVDVGTTNFGIELIFGIWSGIIINVLKFLKKEMPNLYLTARIVQ